MRKRYQKGSLQKVDGVWIARWWEKGRRRGRTLGRVSQMTKAQAQAEVAGILAPINSQQGAPSGKCRFGDFVNQVFFPFYERKWKRSSAITTEDRIENHLNSELGTRSVETIGRNELQDLLDRKAAEGLSHSMVDHLRWDLKQIFGMAVTEGFLQRNPAVLLFTPKEATRLPRRVMTWQDVRKALSVLDLRERLIVRLAIVAGLRAGEVFGLSWGRLQEQSADIQQRIYKGDLDTPKTVNSVRKAALSDRLLSEIGEWKRRSSDTSPGAWVFPSETMKTPLSKENCWQRYIAPKLKATGLGWVNFQVMRRTHSSLMSDLKVNPKVVADQLGHTLDVNQNVYTQTTLDRRKKAVDLFEATLAKTGEETPVVM